MTEQITTVSSVIQHGVVSIAFLLFIVGLYAKAPGMWKEWLATKELLKRLEYEEAERVRKWQTEKDHFDATARHNAVSAHSAQLNFIMDAHEKIVRMVSDRSCRYPQFTLQEHSPDAPKSHPSSSALMG